METPSIADFLGSSSETMKSTSDEILSLLRVMLAEALNQQDRNLAAQLYETIRSISNLDEVLYYRSLSDSNLRENDYNWACYE